MEEAQNEQQATQPGPEEKGIKGFFRKHWPVMFLALLIGYVILLGIGVTAEVFKIQSILDWWIWKAPSR